MFFCVFHKNGAPYINNIKKKESMCNLYVCCVYDIYDVDMCFYGLWLLLIQKPLIKDMSQQSRNTGARLARFHVTNIHITQKWMIWCHDVSCHVMSCHVMSCHALTKGP